MRNASQGHTLSATFGLLLLLHLLAFTPTAAAASETILDRSVNGNTATTNGNAAVTTLGHAGRGLHSPGALGDHASAPHSTTMNIPSGAAGATWAMWVHPRTSSLEPFLVRENHYRVWWANGNIQYEVFCSSGWKSIVPSELAPLNTWTHIAATYTNGATPTWRTYINGVGTAAVGAGSCTYGTAVAPLGLLGDNTHGSPDAIVDDVTGYARVLSDAEITTLRDGGLPSTALMFRYDFERPPDTVTMTREATRAPRVYLNVTTTATATHYSLRRDGAEFANLSTNASWIDYNVQHGQTYQYAVRPYNATNGLAGPITTLTPVRVPLAFPPPPTLSASAEPTVVSLTWTTSAQATSYTLKRDGATLATVTNSSWADAQRIPGTTYTYTVSGFNADGEAGAAGEATVRTPFGPPTAPIFAAAGGAGQVSLAWAPGANTSYYHIHRGALLVANSTGTAFTETGLPYGTTFVYTLTPFNADGVEGPSAEASATTNPAPSGTDVGPFYVNSTTGALHLNVSYGSDPGLLLISRNPAVTAAGVPFTLVARGPSGTVNMNLDKEGDLAYDVVRDGRDLVLHVTYTTPGTKHYLVRAMTATNETAYAVGVVTVLPAGAQTVVAGAPPKSLMDGLNGLDPVPEPKELFWWALGWVAFLGTFALAFAAIVTISINF